MSKNLAEPSTQRFIAGHGYNIRNLTRRPASYDTIFGPWQLYFMVPLATDFNSFRDEFGFGRIKIGAHGLANGVPHNFTNNNFEIAGFSGAPSTRTAADGDYTTAVARIGPQDSYWGVAMAGLKGPDYGNIDLQVASFQELGTGQTEDPSAATFITTHTNIAGGFAAALANEVWNVNPAIKLTGIDGAPFTTILSYSSGVAIIDGGPGLYAFKLIVNGKNISSSGYKGAFSEWIIGRFGAYSDSVQTW